jgi:hypothetical protein
MNPVLYPDSLTYFIVKVAILMLVVLIYWLATPSPVI